MSIILFSIIEIGTELKICGGKIKIKKTSVVEISKFGYRQLKIGIKGDYVVLANPAMTTFFNGNRANLESCSLYMDYFTQQEEDVSVKNDLSVEFISCVMILLLEEITYHLEEKTWVELLNKRKKDDILVITYLYM